MKTEKQHFVYHSNNRFTLVGIVVPTQLRIYGVDAFMLHLGLAVCRDGDQFSRKMGRAIASGRAEKKPFEVIENVPQDRLADLFYSGAIQMAEEKVNEINARQWRAKDTVNRYIKEWEGFGDRDKLKGMKVNHLIGNKNESTSFEVEENYRLNNLKTSRDDYDFIK